MLFVQYIYLLLGAFLSFSDLSREGYNGAKARSGNEICDNAIDDDGDGMIDLNDSDCECIVLEPVSLIPNPSFEDRNCCPAAQSQLSCADIWIQASEPTTDFIHTCNWMGWPDFPPPLPFPDGDGIMGFRDGRVRGNNGEANPFWKEYAGACLLSPLLADTPYIFEFYVGFVNKQKSPDINITFFGTADCDNLPFGVGNEAFGCPTNDPVWIRLGSNHVSGGIGNRWVRTKIEVTPQENISAIAIGPDCPPVSSPVSIYYFFDNLTLVDLRSFQYQITGQSHPCSEDFILKVPSEAGFTYQWYKNGIALIGEIGHQLSIMYGEGEYQVRTLNGSYCSLTGIYTHEIPVASRQIVKKICHDDVYSFGDRLLIDAGMYIDTFKSINNCDSIVLLELQVEKILEDTIHAKIFDGEILKMEDQEFQQKGEYLLNLVSSLGCDSLVTLYLDYYRLFIPNVFTPNGDGINDVFSVSAGSDPVEKITLTVFDRWGNQIFQGTEWDGSGRLNVVNPGVYVYVAAIVMEDGMERLFSGEVTMIR